MTNLDSILKSRDITLPTKVRLVKAMVFPVVMYGCESWTVKKAERRRIDAFEVWCWGRLLRVPWTARRSSQSILKEIGSECSLEGRDPLWWPQERPVPMRVARGPLESPLPSMPGLRPCVEWVREPEDSSPVPTWILGYFWRLPRGVSPRLHWGHAGRISSRAVAAESRFPSRGSRDMWLSLEAFPRGFPTRLSHWAVLRATIV